MNFSKPTGSSSYAYINAVMNVLGMVHRIKFPKNELNLNYTFNGGQAFRWCRVEDDSWIGVFAHRVWTLRQDEEHLIYQTVKSKNAKDDDEESLLRGYFRLHEPLNALYDEWSKCDPKFSEAAKKFSGVRMLQQEPIENIFTFICSSNNNISRIKSMVEKLCRFYGDEICIVNGIQYYDFPRVEILAKSSVDDDLKKAAFGYRAKFIQQSARKIVEFGGQEWISQLLVLPYNEAKTELMKLPGIGAKVADCICLMSLGHLEAIPVDTHVFQIAVRYYLPHLKNVKSVTDRVYNEIGDHFRSLYGKYAGWPHCVLFCDELKIFQDRSSGKRQKIHEENRRRKKSKS